MSKTNGIVYQPSDDEPFMNERQREYFRLKLLNWKDEILHESKETLLSLQDENNVAAGLGRPGVHRDRPGPRAQDARSATQADIEDRCRAEADRGRLLWLLRGDRRADQPAPARRPTDRHAVDRGAATRGGKRSTARTEVASEILPYIAVAPSEPWLVAVHRPQIRWSVVTEYRRSGCRARSDRAQRIGAERLRLLSRGDRYRAATPARTRAAARSPGWPHARLAAAGNAWFDHHVHATDQHQVLDIVASHKNESPRLVDLIIFADTQAHARRPPIPPWKP